MCVPTLRGDDVSDDDWQRLWDARCEALATLLGEPDDIVRHALIMFELGPDAGGAADILYFREHLGGGVAAVTAELIGCKAQLPNRHGNYELMIAARSDEELEPWANLLSRLAYLTFELRLNPGDSLSLDGVQPPGSAIEGFLFVDHGRVVVEGTQCGVLLCVGITREELLACQAGHGPTVEMALRESGVFPFTVSHRGSSLDPLPDDEPGFFARLFRR